MKAYKGFNKDMTCRGFQYEEGKTYETNKAKLCAEGFHACENPLDCFNYYEPGTSVYREVEIEDNGERHSQDSKVVGKKITIGAELSVAQICKLHFEYTKSRCTNSVEGADFAALEAGDSASVNAGNSASVNAGNRASVNAGDSASVNAGDSASVNAGDSASVNAGYRASVNAGYSASVNAGYRASVNAGDRASVNAGNSASVNAGYRASVNAGDSASVNAGNRASVNAGDRASVNAGEASVLRGGVETKFKGGMYSVFACEVRDEYYNLIGMKTAVVDGKKILPNVWYTVKNGKWVKCKEETK